VVLRGHRDGCGVDQGFLAGDFSEAITGRCGKEFPWSSEVGPWWAFSELPCDFLPELEVSPVFACLDEAGPSGCLLDCREDGGSDIAGVADAATARWCQGRGTVA
jgi:hypothetical protein